MTPFKNSSPSMELEGDEFFFKYIENMKVVKIILVLTLGIAIPLSLLLGCNSDKAGKQASEKQKGSSPGEQKVDKTSSQNVNSIKESDTSRSKESPTSLTAEREKLLAQVKAQSKDPQIYLQLGLSCYQEAQALTNNPKRETLEELYKQAIENLEKAKSLFEDGKQPIELYQALWESYRNLAYLPVTFNQGTDPDYGVVPFNMKNMKKAIETYEEAKAKFPSDPATAPETGNKLAADLKNLEAVYLTNVQRQWNEMNESGYRKPETYQEKVHR
jgi:tetratricopeptide (TPR) repeat protein